MVWLDISKPVSYSSSSFLGSFDRATARLRRAVENSKKALSSATVVDVEVDAIADDVNFSASLTRAKFEELNAELFARCIDTVLTVVEDAEITRDDVTDIVLVGGSTRVPYLQKKLYELFDGRIELCKTIHPDEAVAIGAAVQGRILASGGSGGGKELSSNETTTDLLLLDVTPLSLGIELEGRAMSTLIKRNTAIPCRKTRTYTVVLTLVRRGGGTAARGAVPLPPPVRCRPCTPSRRPCDGAACWPPAPPSATPRGSSPGTRRGAGAGTGSGRSRRCSAPPRRSGW